MLQDRLAARGLAVGGGIAAQIGSREHGSQRIDGVHAAPFHAP